MFVKSNGVTFHVQIDGPDPTDNTPTLLLLHGFTGSIVGWDYLVSHLSPLIRLIRIDLIGHGRTDSPRDAGRYSMNHAVMDVVHILDHFDVEKCALLGYSMGARLALHIALEVPDRIQRLILESGTYGIESPSLRAQRVKDDEALARWIEKNGTDAFALRWEEHPIFATQYRLPSEIMARQRRERRQHEALGLANSLRGMGTGSQACLRDQLGMIRIPTLLICGELDDKFTRLAHEMHELIPQAQLAVVDDAGHNVHLERPEVFVQHVSRFIRPPEDA